MSATTGTPANSLKSVSLYTGQASVSNTDFGYNWSGTIGDTVFYDSNGNGTQNGGETGVPNVTLALVWDQNGNGAVDLGEPALTVAFTNGSGVYAFNDMPPGRYVVQAAGQTVESPTSAGVYGTMVPTSSYGENYAVDLAGSVLTADFGFIEAARVEGTVFYDANATAPGWAGQRPSGVTVTLTGTDLNGAAVTRSMVTPSGGGYDFLVPPGTYSITYDPAPVLGLPDISTTPLTIALAAVGGVEYTGQRFRSHVLGQRRQLRLERHQRRRHPDGRRAWHRRCHGESVCQRRHDVARDHGDFRERALQLRGPRRWKLRGQGGPRHVAGRLHRHWGRQCILRWRMRQHHRCHRGR